MNQYVINGETLVAIADATREKSGVSDPIKVSDLSAIIAAIETTLVGELKWIAGRDADFDKWLICDGREVNIEDYPNLYAAIGHTFGMTTDDTTLFKLPDARGRIIGMGSETHLIGESIGSDSIEITRTYLPDYKLWVSPESAGYPTGTVSIGTKYPIGSSSYYVPYSSSTWEKDQGKNIDGTGGYYPKQDGNQNINSTNLGHNHSATFNGDWMDTHTHNVYLDGEGNALPIMQPTLFIGNLFIHI